MTMVRLTRNETVFDKFFHELTEFGGRAGNAWARYRAYSNAMAELRQLSDRELNDIGISRFDIQRVAREAAADVGAAR